MANLIKMVMEYSIRHLKMNSLCIGMVDRLVADRIDSNYRGAKQLLKEVYQPETYTHTKIVREVSHQFNLQIIIPMFNVGKFISQCLDSILKQDTKYSYKIILVDDGSTDRTLEYVEKYIDNEHICFISQNNSGTAIARNVALESLVADYIMFIDADDMLKPGAISKLLDVAYKKDADIVEGGYNIFHNKVVTRKTHKDAVLNEAGEKLWGFSWAKVIRSELFVDMDFPDKYWYEDTIIAYLIYTRCQCIVTISDIVYSYRKCRKGMSRIRGKNIKILDAYWIIDLVINEMIKRNITFTQGIYEQLLISIVTSSKRIMYLPKSVRSCVLAAYSDILHSHFDDVRSQIDKLKVFEKVLRNNDFRKYRYLVICMESL